MKIRILILTISMVFVLTTTEKVNAQTETRLPLDGVLNFEFQYQQGACMGSEVIYLKGINNNNNAVPVIWSLWQSGSSHTVFFDALEEQTYDCFETFVQELHEFIP